jgi:hypothetical protein
VTHPYCRAIDVRWRRRTSERSNEITAWGRRCFVFLISEGKSREGEIFEVFPRTGFGPGVCDEMLGRVMSLLAVILLRLKVGTCTVTLVRGFRRTGARIGKESSIIVSPDLYRRVRGTTTATR